MIWPFGQKKQEKAKSATAHYRRGFEAALINRLTQSWVTSSQSIDWDLRNSLPILRARSRDVTINDPYGRKFLQMVSAHVVGPNGFSLQARVMTTDQKGSRPDGLASTAIENGWFEWSKRGNCDVTGKLSMFDIENITIKAVARDGEALIRKIRDNSKFGFRLQVLDIDRLDTDKNETLRDGRIIKMGVELDRYGVPIAYWVRENHPGDSTYYTHQGNTFVRVPADEMYHIFIPDRPEQNRGFPWMAPVLSRLKNLNGYEDAAVVAARVGAAKMGFYTTPDGDGSPLSDGVDADGNLMTDAEPGTLQVLPPGYGLESFNPDYPHAMFGSFVKACLRGVASGIGVAYNTLSNDLEGVNFSSIRTGVLEERDNWMVIQNWFIEQFLNDLYSEWLRWALLKGAITMPNGSPLPVAKYDKFNVGVFQGRRWQWVDPKADVEANILSINNGLKSRRDVIAEQGKDIEDVFAALAAEQTMLEDMGIETTSPNPNQMAKDAAAKASDEQNKPVE